VAAFVAPQEVYDEAVAALTLLRGGSLRQRIAASYLVPDRHDWVGADLADLPEDYHGPGHLLFDSAAAEQLQTARLEEAMIVQRRWTPGDFQSRIAAHPLLGRLARTPSSRRGRPAGRTAVRPLAERP
jgi:hypothetical protein